MGECEKKSVIRKYNWIETISIFNNRKLFYHKTYCPIIYIHDVYFYNDQLSQQRQACDNVQNRLPKKSNEHNLSGSNIT